MAPTGDGAVKKRGRQPKDGNGTTKKTVKRTKKKKDESSEDDYSDLDDFSGDEAGNGVKGESQVGAGDMGPESDPMHNQNLEQLMNATREPLSEETIAKFDLTLGSLLISGGTNWDMLGRKELPKNLKASGLAAPANLWGPHKWNVETRVRAVISSANACHSVVITEDGKAMTFGRNDKGQLGHGDLNKRDTPELVKPLLSHQIVGAATGRGHTLFLTSKGIVFACGDNKMGQLGIGQENRATVLSPIRVSYAGKPIVKMACGAEFSMIVDESGNLFSFGSPEYGQLGHNCEGKYFTTGNKIAYRCEWSPRKVVMWIEKSREGHIKPLDDVIVKEVACGTNHSLAVDSKKRCFSWGFAGYGRLGHSETKNELMPRSIKTFDLPNRGAVKVWAGSQFSLALDQNGLLMFWGQNKPSGEATMYPKNVQDLSGWNIRSVGCANKSIVVAADDSVISWGPSPTYGELAYGEGKSKSSTTPQEAKTLNGIYCQRITCGYAHSLFIARDENDAEKDLINKLPVWP